MVASITEIIAAINPDLYYIGTSEEKRKLKKLVKELGILQAIDAIKDEKGKFETQAIRYIMEPGPDLKFKMVTQNKGQDTGVEAKHSLIYDSSVETLEPVYFFLLDLMEDYGLKTEKLVDNFSTSVGSGHFSEMGQKATRMQEEAMKIFGTINTVVRSVLNLVYDLKEFRIRLEHYEDLSSSKKEIREGALLALKQIWMDKVDINKGNSSIKAMALGQAGFQTLIDAFLIARDEKHVNELDLNDRVKRILKERIFEFNHWLLQSERELKSRYELERNYLKSQVNSLQLYSRWLKPYLKYAKDLEMKETGRSPSLVKAFDSIVLELTLFGKSTIDPKSAALGGDLPRDFIKMKVKRNYNACVLIDFNFRGIPQRAGQGHYAFGGRTEVTFRAYALNDDELKKLDETLKKADLEDALKYIQGATDESLKVLQDDINFFLEDKTKEKKAKEQSIGIKDVFEPFFALFGMTEKETSKKTESKSGKKEIILIEDNWLEKTHLRTLAAATAENTAFALFDVYKKSHQMVSYT